MQTDLYRHYDASGILLYVGVSMFVLMRTLTHRTQSSWFNNVCTITIERFETRELAIAAERKAITTEHPVHNLDQTPKRSQKRSGWVDDETRATTYDIKQLAAMMGVHPSTVRNWADYKKEPFIPIEGMRPYRWLRSDVDAILKPTVQRT